SFDEIYSPGFEYDTTQTARVLEDYARGIFETETPGEAKGDTGDELKEETKPGESAEAMLPAEPAGEPAQAEKQDSGLVPATVMGQLTWHYLVHGGWDEIAQRYVFDARPLTNTRPYFAAYVKPGDIPRVTDRLELLQDEWGYLLLWATLAIACLAALSLVL